MTTYTNCKNQSFPVSCVFFDVDDTLFDHQTNQIPDGYLEAIQILKDKGVRVCLSTGRSRELTEWLIGSAIDLFDGIVAGNGAYVYDENGRLLFEKTFSKETFEKLMEITYRHGGGIFASGSSAFIFDAIPAVQAKLDSVHVTDIPCRKPEAEDRFSVLSLCHEHPEVLDADLDALGGLAVQKFDCSRDVSRSDLSKFEGIRILMNHWNLPIRDYAAFGDSDNDLEMLENAAISIAPDNSQDSVRAIVQFVAPPVEQGGLAEWMKKAGWLE